MSKASRYMRAASVVAALFVLTGPADARCTINATGISITPTSASTGIYTPPTAPTAVSTSFTVSGTYNTNNTAGTCRVAISWNRASLPASMARTGGGATLPYTIQTLSTGGNTLLFTGGGTPGAANRLLASFTSAGANLTNRAFSVVMTVYFLQQPGTNQRAGNYLDGPTVRIYNVTGGGTATQLASVGFSVSGAVSLSCTIGGATAGALDTANIPVSPTGTVTTTPIAKSYANVVCNSFSNLSVSSLSGAVKNTGAAPSGFTNLIDYTASATYGGATSSLNTSTIATATGAEAGSTGTTTAATTSGSLAVTITPLTPASRLRAGSYSDTLRVTITAQ